MTLQNFFLVTRPILRNRCRPATPNPWYPQIREFKGRIVPVKSLILIYWGDLDEKTNVVKPISLWKIQGNEKTSSQR